ncbi:MAG: GNAT family N-acetyltransferase [Thermoplasmata archaeon]|nr:GNAT family N-acetyltransferase [Thermoplasmata archaeon]
MNIRKARKEDLRVCLDIDHRDNEYYWKPQDLENSVEDQHAIFLVAEEEQKVIGYIIGFIVPTKRAEAMIHVTRVDIPERKRGIGKKLVDDFCKEAFKRGADIVIAEIVPELLGFYRDVCGLEEKGNWIAVGKGREAQ